MPAPIASIKSQAIAKNPDAYGGKNITVDDSPFSARQGITDLPTFTDFDDNAVRLESFVGGRSVDFQAPQLVAYLNQIEQRIDALEQGLDNYLPQFEQRIMDIVTRVHTFIVVKQGL
jgi:hypothetical protein